MKSNGTNTLRFALPKGRVLPALQEILTAAGLAPAENLKTSRRLVAPIPSAKKELGVALELLLLKNSDVPVYVEHGVADLGVSGTDVLNEKNVNVLKPHTFGFGKCRIVVAGRPEHDQDWLRRQPIVHVATKYVGYARDHFAKLGWPVEIIPLAGSVELAPVLGLADAIVDLTETGNTLRENGLVAHDVIGETALKLIANRALSRTTIAVVERLVTRLSAAEKQVGPL